MELSTLNTELKISEVKPEKSLQTYLQRVAGETANLLAESIVAESCPACGSKDASASFEKNGFHYQRCNSCFSLFTQERPSEKAITAFYESSESRNFWINEIWQESSAARSQKVLQPSLDWINDIFASYGRNLNSENGNIAEFRPTNPGMSLVWPKTDGKKLSAIEPHFPNSEKWVDAKSAVASAETKDKFEAVLLMDALDRSTNPEKEMMWARENLVEGGLCFVTGVLSSGLDSLFLGGELNAMTAPDRLNSFSFEGFKKFADRCGFEVLEFSTPGALDLQNLNSAVSSGNAKSDFLKYLFSVRDNDAVLEELQKFLQLHRLSSRLRAVLRVK